MEATRNVAMNECPVCGVNKGKSVYNCEYCDATFNSMSGLGRHRGAKHAVEYSAPAIICPICRESVKSHRELAEHAHQQHAENSDDFVVETIRFQDLQDYKSWKLASEEAGVISRFITRTKTTEHAKVTYLRCHCSFYCPSSPPQKTKKSVPYCTAYMNVTERIDGVTVEHCLTHLGHEALPSQLRLDENAEKYIVSLLKDGLTVQQVHKKIRMHVGGGPRTRLYFTTTRDIRNLAAKSRVQRGKLNNLDAASVQMQVDAKSEFDGRRSHEAVTLGSSAFHGNIGEEVQSSDRDEEMMTKVTIKDYRNDEKVPRTWQICKTAAVTFFKQLKWASLQYAPTLAEY
ncbi:hypothetical protein RB195_012876 [Necator americanus]|uniref:C2H2-type domain-containing protein n=1 Tax=Necator americanus TaxID=51031 RepID=A0ABR1DSY9_NECAM